MKKKIYESVWWETLAVIPTRAINYTATIILARILTPQIFGEFSYVLIIFQYFALAENPGLQSAFIHSHEKPEKAAGTFLALNISIGLFLFILINLTAGLFSVFFQSENLAVLMRWVSVSFLFNCTALVQGAWLAKTMDFKKKMYAQVLSALFSSSLAVYLAVVGHGIWSLVGRHVSLSLLNAIILMLVLKKRLEIRFDKKIAVSLLKYALPFHSTIILGFLSLNLDYLFVGKYLGAKALGLYRMAFNIVSLPIYNLSLAVSSIAFPAFSMIRSNRSDLKSHFYRIFGIQIGFISTISFLFVVIPDSIVRMFFGEKWIEMVQPMRFLALFIFLRALTAPFFECYKAKGILKVRIVLSLAAISLLIPGLMLGCQYGTTGVALTHLILFAPFFILEFYLARRYFGFNWKEILQSNRIIILCQIFIFILFCGIKILVPSDIPFYHQIMIITLSSITGLYYLAYMNIIRKKAF